MDPADSLDTAILTAGTRGWAGVQNRQKPGLLDAAALAMLVNGRLDDTGSVQLRPGTAWLCQPVAAQPRGLFYYDVDTAEAILACVNGRVYEIPASTGPVQPIAIPDAILSTSGTCRGAQLVDKFAIADGLRLLGLWREAGAWRTMQVATFKDGQALPAVRHVLSHGFRLFICGGTGATAQTIYASDVLDPWTISSAVGIQIGRGEGDRIEVLLPGPQQTIFALQAGSSYVVNVAGASTAWTQECISQQIGCWAGATAVVVNQDVLFLSRRGVANLAKLQNDAPVSAVDFISAPIEATIARINWSAARTCACATLWGGYYLLAVPLDGAQRNNTVLAYNTTTQQWSGEWTGWTPEAWCQSQFDGQLATIMADRAGNIVRLDDAITTDGSADGATAIPLELETAAFAFEAPDLLKLPVALDCEWRGAEATVDVTLRADGGSPQTIAEDFEATPESGGINRRLIGNLRELRGGREMQIRMVTTGGAFGLRELTIKALPLRARWEAPPAELLAVPVPAEDQGGTPTTLLDGQGNSYTIALQEIDTITLPHDSLDFTCFRGGLTVPAGSYIIAYRRGSFTDHVAPVVSDLPAPTGLVATPGDEAVALAWDAATDERIASWAVYMAGALVAVVSSLTYTLAVPGGGTVAVAIFSRTADNAESATSATASATALPPLPTPSGLAATQGTNAVTLTWTASTDVRVTGYQIRRDGVAIATVIATTYTDPVIAGTSHGWTVSACSMTTSSAPSAAVTTQAYGEPAPGIVGELAILTDSLTSSGYGWAGMGTFESVDYIWVSEIPTQTGPVATMAGGIGWLDIGTFETLT